MLINLIENAEQGAFLLRADTGIKDEIGQVVLGFNQLLGKITQDEAKKLENESNIVEAKIQSARAKNLLEKLDETNKKQAKLDKKLQSQNILMEAAHRFGGTLKKETIISSLSDLFMDKLNWPSNAIFLQDQNKKGKTNLFLETSFGFKENGPIKNRRVQLGEGIAGIVAQTGASYFVGNLAIGRPIKFWQDIDDTIENKPLVSGSVLAVPMLYKARVVGVIGFYNEKPNFFDDDDLSLMSALGAQAAMAIVNAQLYEKTLELATVDPLTGVMNRRQMVKQLEQELLRSQRFNTPLTVLLLDVDFFKTFNDQMGHVLGDVALKNIATALKSSIRKVDLIARFGGEEFCIILPQSDQKAAIDVAKKIGQVVQNITMRGAEKQPFGFLSLSIGVVTLPNDFDTKTEEIGVTNIINKADKALYEAKKRGRNNFVCFSEIKDSQK